MSDTTTQVNIRLEAEDRAAEVIRSLKRDVDALSKSLRNLTQLKMPAFASGSPLGSPGQAADALRVNAQLLAASERQASRQRAADARTEDRQRKVMEATALRDLRAREAANARAARQQLAGIRAVEQEERRAAAETERQDSAARSQHARDTRYLSGLRHRHERDQRREHDRTERDMRRNGREAWSRGRDAYHDTTRPVGMAALAGTAASAAATRRILGAELDVDAAEINSRSYGGLSEKAARALRTDWASPIAESLGAETSKLLTAWVDATKLGIPASGARAFAELATKTSSAWEVPFENVTDIFGTINTLLTSKGEEFSADRLKSVANALQHLAAKQSTTPEKLISFLQRGAGAAQVLGMSQEAGLAFGSASTSLGNQAGQSGRMFDYIASRVIEMPRLTQRDGEEGDQARALVKALGYTSAEQMDRQRRADPDSFMPDFMSRFSNIKQKKKQDEAIRFFTGREWLGEFGRMVKGADTYKEAVRLSKESKGLDAIGAVWDLHRLKLRFVFKQFRAGWLNILGEAGKELSPLARQAGDYFLGWSANLRNGGLQARVKAALEGLVTGLGFKDMPALLRGIFGEPGQGAAGSIQAWRDAARGFGEGLRDVGNAIRSFFTLFTGSNASPETIGRWTARILGFGAALLIASPAITLLSGLASAILGLGSAAATAFAAFKVAGLAGGAGAAGAIGTGVLATAGALIGTAFLATIANKMGILTPPDMSKGWGRGFLEFLDPGLARRLLGDEPKLEKQSYGDGDHNGAFDRRLIQPAAFITGDLTAGLDRLGRVLGATGARAQLATLGASSSTGLGNFVGGGSSGGGVPGFSGGSAPTVPGWFNHGGRGGGGGGVTGIPDSVPMTPEERNTLGLIMKYESGGQNKMNYMGLSQGLSPETAKGYTAQGYFQMLNSNWRRIAPKLGIKTPNAMASSLEDQTRVALHLLRNGGIQNWSNYNPKLRAALARGERAPTGSLPPNLGGASASGALVGGVHPLDGKGRLTSDFGMRRHPLSGMLKPHRGIDLAAPGGTAVKAMRDGTVSIDRSGDVTVKHPDGTSTTYRHVNPGVKQGDQVAAGQQIATLRQHDPRSTGPHLHLEGRDAKGGLIDPKTLLQPKPKEPAAVAEGGGAGGYIKDLDGKIVPYKGGLLGPDGKPAKKPASPGMEPFKSTGWQPDSWVQSDGGAWKNKRTGELADAARTARLEEQAAKAREQARKFLGGEWRDKDGNPGLTSSGWKPKARGVDPAPADPGFSSSGWKPASAADAIRKLPVPEPKLALGGGQGDRAGMGPAGGSTMRGGSTVHVVNHIQAGNQSPSEMAAHIQRHITEAWNYRAHDLEPELT